eukprot:scaffold18043_cov73-Skeletonema_marinoi.AAC.1
MPAASGSLVLREKSFFNMLGMMTTIIVLLLSLCVVIINSSNYTTQKSILDDCIVMMMAGGFQAVLSTLILSCFELFEGASELGWRVEG